MDGIQPSESTERRCNEKDVGTMIAALRLYQLLMQRVPTQIPVEIQDLASDEGRIQPLSSNEIDVLCERINFGDVF